MCVINSVLRVSEEMIKNLSNYQRSCRHCETGASLVRCEVVGIFRRVWRFDTSVFAASRPLANWRSIATVSCNCFNTELLSNNNDVAVRCCSRCAISRVNCSAARCKFVVAVVAAKLRSVIDVPKLCTLSVRPALKHITKNITCVSAFMSYYW